MKLKITLGLFIVSLAILCAKVVAQDVLEQRKKYLVDPKTPSVYLALEKIASNPKNLNSSRKDRIFVRLYNNLRWPIRLTVSSARKGEGDVRMDYVFLNSHGQVIDGVSCHVCTRIPLHSGKNLLFSIPKADITTAKRIRVQYSFWWEDSRDEGTEKEPLHYVTLTLEPEGTAMSTWQREF